MGRSWVDLMSYHPQLPPFIIRAVAETLKLNPKEKIK